ncbi:metallophosphoesterase [Clostridiaceae bacterium M8S5]|nr:metallophosphoesterase [Clostridiaceae bacterium M8S5]
MDKILRYKLEGDYRIVAISDIHGGYELLKKLIDRVNLREKDYLVIIGDIIQKGKYNMQTLQYVKELSKRKNTIILAGNHERKILHMLKEENCTDVDSYFKTKKHPCILKEWMKELNIKYNNIEDVLNIQNQIKSRYKDDIKFLESLPIALELDDFIFVHAGIDDIEDWTKSKTWNMIKTKGFLDKQHKADKYVIVGHWPTQNYRENSLSGDVIIDKDKKIIAIDGGYSVMTTGQVNALVIEKLEGKLLFNSLREDYFERVQVIKDTLPHKFQVMKLDCRGTEFEILKENKEFSICKVANVSDEVLIKNEFIDKTKSKLSLKKTYISLFLEVKNGDNIKLIKRCGEYVLAKHNGEVGWIKADCVNI